MKSHFSHTVVTYFISSVWLINGLFCKILDLVPRHQEIVASIVGETYALQLTWIIGFFEILMAVWILSGYLSKLVAWFQIIIVGLMNIIEFIVVPELLLWGKMNIVFACLFIALVYWHQFIWTPKIKSPSYP